MGYQALLLNTKGSDNVAIGESSLTNNSTAIQNIAIGKRALYSQSYSNSGTPYYSNNLAVGAYALTSNNPSSLTNGIENTAVGNNTMTDNTTGYANTATGFRALQNNEIGFYNTASGYESLYNNTSGYQNTAQGYQTLYPNSTGYFNTALGSIAYFFAGSLQNTTCLGFGSGGQADNDNRIELGNASVSWIGGEVDWLTYSDARIKDNVKENVPGLDFITRLRPVTYNLNIHRQNALVYQGKKDEGDWPSKYDIEKQTMTGFIAQDVEKAAKETGFNFSGLVVPSNPQDLYSLGYASFVVPLVKAAQELSARNNEQDELILNLKQEVEIQKINNEKLAERIEKLESLLKPND